MLALIVARQQDKHRKCDNRACIFACPGVLQGPRGLHGVNNAGELTLIFKRCVGSGATGS